MFRLLVENRITQIKENYKCYHCRFKISNTYEANVFEHINSDYHNERAEIHKWDKIETNKKLEKLMKLSETEYQKLVKNGIVFKGTHFSCYCCNKSKFSLRKHLAGVKHKLNYEDIDIPLIKGTNIVIGSVINSTVPTFDYKNLKANYIQFNRAANTYTCYICQVLIDGPLETFDHIIGRSHLEKLKQHKISRLPEIQKNAEIKNDITEKDLFYYYCEKCDVYLTLNEILVQCHCLLHLHDELPNLYGKLPYFNFDIMEVNFTEDNMNIKCLLCDKTVNSEKN